MNKLIVAAVATAVSAFVAAPAQAAPPSGGSTTSSVTVVNTTAAPVPTTVQNVVGVDVLAGPDTRARIWQGYCTIAIGEYTCSLIKWVSAPPGMVMRVVGLTGVINGPCKESGGHVVLTGAFQAPGAAEVPTRIATSGTVLRPSPTSTRTLLQFQGNAFFTTIKLAEFSFDSGTAACGNSFGDITVHYVLEPLA